MKKQKPDVSAAAVVRVRTYCIVSDAVEQAVSSGLRRAHKHTDSPDRETIAEHVHSAVMGALCEVFDFEPAGYP